MFINYLKCKIINLVNENSVIIAKKGERRKIPFESRMAKQETRNEQLEVLLSTYIKGSCRGRFCRNGTC